MVGWNSLRYFLIRKDPDRAARDLELILRHYLGRWHKKRVILIGYSFGADSSTVCIVKIDFVFGCVRAVSIAPRADESIGSQNDLRVQTDFRVFDQKGRGDIKPADGCVGLCFFRA